MNEFYDEGACYACPSDRPFSYGLQDDETKCYTCLEVSQFQCGTYPYV